MTVGDKFKSVESNGIFTVVKLDDKFKQAIIEDSEGNTKVCSAATLNNEKFYTKVGEDNAESNVEKPAEEPAEESIKEESIKEEPVKKPSKTNNNTGNSVGFLIKDFIIEKAHSIGADVCIANNGKFISFKTNGKMFAAIFSFSKKSATIGVRSASIEGKDLECDKKTKHMMDCRFLFNTLLPGDKEKIDILLRSSKEHQENKGKK